MVNTFVLSNCPRRTMELLDAKRLGKQRVEAYQIINALGNSSTGWKNHPITQMWKDNIEGLKFYFNCSVDEWVKRGYKNTMNKFDNVSEDSLPWWFFNEQLQKTHKASLLRKDPVFYTPLFPLEKEYYDTGYIWTAKLPDNIIEKMKRNETCELKEICAKIGTGAPVQFSYSKEEVVLWLKNPEVNPKTNKKIKKDGPMYCNFEKAKKFYEL